ncbi:MAG: RidA family protein [Acidobacteriota bacterium]
MKKQPAGLFILIIGIFLCFSFCQTPDLEEVVTVKEVIEMEGAEGMPFSPAVRFGNLLFLSGSIGMDPETNEMPPDAGEQTKNCLERLGAILEQAHMDYSDVVKCTVYLTDLEDYAEMNKAYSSFFPEDPPARACVQVAGLVREAKVEISMIAAK